MSNNINKDPFYISLVIKEINQNTLEKSEYRNIERLKDGTEKFNKKLEEQKRNIKKYDEKRNKEIEAFNKHFVEVRKRKENQDFILLKTQREYFNAKNNYYNEINKIKKK